MIGDGLMESTSNDDVGETWSQSAKHIASSAPNADEDVRKRGKNKMKISNLALEAVSSKERETVKKFILEQ